MRSLKKDQIRLGRVRSGSRSILRVAPDSRQIMNRYSPRSQRVIIKVKQSYNSKPGSWRRHGHYLERDRARDGDGFSANETKVSIPETLERWQKTGDKKLHKIILSPEQAKVLSLESP